MLAFATLLAPSAGCSKTVSNPPPVPVETAPLVMPGEAGPILVLVDHLPGHESFAEERAEQVVIGLRHFSEQTSWDYVDSAPIAKVNSAAAVVYLGMNGIDALSPDSLVRLRCAHHLIVSGYHLANLRETRIAFRHTEGGHDIVTPPNTFVRYKGQTFPSDQTDFLVFKAKEAAHVIAEYTLADKTTLPYVLQDDDALFINGDIAFASEEVGWRGAMLTICDAITQFLTAEPVPARPQAMLRLEDVSSLTPAPQLESIVEYLAAARVPYGIGVIPDVHVKGKTVKPLRDNQELLKVLRRANSHGATTILHGLHHCCSSESSEGYEYWDVDHNAPLPGDSAEWMRANVTEALADLTSLGLHPQLWETPHYSASPADYGVVSEYFGAAWELRRPIGWLPWVLKRDQYGAMVLPDSLGYISLDGKKTVGDQLVRARELLVCQTCLAAGFIHPNTVPVEEVRKYVEGLRELGYVFVDPAEAITHKSIQVGN